MGFFLNVLFSAVVISAVTWLAGRYAGTAGFIASLPLTTMLVLPLTQLQHGNAQITATLARSIFVAVPVTMVFLVPFVLSNRLGLSFWWAYALGCLWLLPAFFLHRVVLKWLA